MKKIIFILAMSAFVACSKPATIHDDSPMMMNAATKSPTDFGAGTPVFLFWSASDWASIGTAGTNPYFTAWPSQDIDAYKTETYNTGKKYPENNADVYCTGYFPASLTVDDGADERTWTKLSVPEEEIGLLDVMVPTKHITGNAGSHFETRDGNKLEFIHAQSKVTFKVKMGTQTSSGTYMRNAKVVIPGKGQFMNTLKWENGRYIAATATDSDAISKVLASPDATQLDPNQEARELGSVYIFPDKSSIVIEAEVEIADNPNFNSSRTVSFNAEVQFNFTDGKASVLRENEKYEITLLINYDHIEIKGRKAEWEEGGGLLIPIYPEGNAA